MATAGSPGAKLMDVKFSMPNILYSLKDLGASETRHLMLHLGLGLNVIEDIVVTPSNAEYAKAQYIQKWLDRDETASWKKLARVLRKIEKIVLARNIEDTYLQPANVDAPPTAAPPYQQVIARVPTGPPPDASISDTNPIPVQDSIDKVSNPYINLTDSPAMREARVKESNDVGQASNPDINFIQLPVVSQDKVSEVKTSIDQLEDKFSSIKSDTRIYLSTKTKPNFLDSFIDHLLDLPASKHLVHLKLFCDSEVDVIEARSVRKLLSIVHCYCDSFNYDLILPAVEKFVSPQHKKLWLAYQELREKLEMKTRIDAYVWAMSAHAKGVTFKGFYKMGIRINRKPTESTVHEIRQLKYRIAENASIHRYSICIDTIRMTESSIQIGLCIHPGCVQLVYLAMESDHNIHIIHCSTEPAIQHSAMGVVEVCTNIKFLQDKYSSLMNKTELSLTKHESEDETFCEKFRHHILNLDQRPMHDKFFSTNEENILEAKNVQRILAILSQYCSYTNYDMIASTIDSFCDPDLQKEISKYQEWIAVFEKTTTINVYLCAISANPDSEIHKQFTKIAREIKKSTSVCTLHEAKKERNF